jgi:hypothetical protein
MKGNTISWLWLRVQIWPPALIEFSRFLVLFFSAEAAQDYVPYLI